MSKHEQSPCPTCGCVLYQESGPCRGSDLIETIKSFEAEAGGFVSSLRTQLDDMADEIEGLSNAAETVDGEDWS